MEDKRSHPRVVIDTSVSCELPGAAPFIGMAKDISIGGMFVESTEKLAFGAHIIIVVRLAGTKADLRLPAIERRVKPGGFGLQFQLLGARETHAISQLLKH